MTTEAIFRAEGDGYRVSFPDCQTDIVIDRLRWDRNEELWGQMSVSTGLTGVKAIGEEGLLSFSSVNLSSSSSRRAKAKELAERARTGTKIDWIGLVDTGAVQVLHAMRKGSPSISLRDAVKPTADDEFDIDGFRFPKHHGTINFGDGGTLKSYVGLYAAGRLAQRGVSVGFFDFELDAGAHRGRLERLFPEMPEIRYVRCDRPLVHEVDRLKKVVRDDRLEFGFFDSIGYAVPGRPEDAEHAMGYFRAVRQLNIGSMHTAHIRQGENNDQRPFGSSFWHNSARSTWFSKLAGAAPDGQCLTVGLFNRKSNLTALRPAVGFQVTFDHDRTYVTRVNVAEVSELADELPLWQRMKSALLHGPRTLVTLAEELRANVDTLDRTVRRKSSVFTRVPGTDGISRIALVETRVA